MKRNLVLLTLVAILMAVATVAFAGDSTRLRVNVPFAFFVGKDLLPAGEYFVELRPVSPSAATATSVYVYSHDGMTARLLLTVPGSAGRLGSDHLLFNKYGDTYFLARVETLGYQANLRVTKGEKELRAEAGTEQKTMLLAER